MSRGKCLIRRLASTLPSTLGAILLAFSAASGAAAAEHVPSVAIQISDVANRELPAVLLKGGPAPYSRRQLAAGNCGFAKADHVAPTIGYLKLTSFAEPGYCTRTAIAAMNFLANPITKGDWEGTGVTPDVKVSAADALAVAEKLAAREIRKVKSRQPGTG